MKALYLIDVKAQQGEEWKIKPDTTIPRSFVAVGSVGELQTTYDNLLQKASELTDVFQMKINVIVLGK